MATAPRHRVKQAVFDLRFPDESTAFAVRKRLEDLFDEAVVPPLEAAFDAYAPNGVEHRVRRLEIDLGTLDPQAITVPAVRTIVAEQVARALSKLELGRDVETIDRVATLVDTLIAFLETGRLAWPAAVSSVAELTAMLDGVSAAAIAPHAPRLLAVLRRPTARFRALHQGERELFEWLVTRLDPQRASAVRAAVTVLSRRYAANDVRTAALSVLAAAPPSPAAATSGVSAEIETAIRRGAARDAPAVPDRAPPPEIAVEADVSSSPTTAPGAEKNDADELYVGGAGVVILHPFLERLFGAIELLDDAGAFRSDVSRVRAIHLLHYLVTGREDPEEPALTLYKFLCGQPFDGPVVRRLDLGRDMRDEASTLLSAVIEHWSALKRTSIEGLRETFLQRDGLLRKSGDQWRLVVERKAPDVLLDALPWGLSPIRFPWLRSMLWVEWA